MCCNHRHNSLSWEFYHLVIISFFCKFLKLHHHWGKVKERRLERQMEFNLAKCMVLHKKRCISDVFVEVAGSLSTSVVGHHPAQF